MVGAEAEPVPQVAQAAGDTGADAQAALEQVLDGLLELPDEKGLDARWTEAAALTREYVTRPAKRVRPKLLMLGYSLAQSTPPPSGLIQCAAALELLHGFMLIHDDVADAAQSRRGGPALHHLLGRGKAGENLAVVMGDHLFARSMEAMLASGLPQAPAAVAYLLGICRHTAAGQYLDLKLAETSLAEVTLFQTLKVAHLKTARYGFVAPPVVGAMLGGASADLIATLERLGRHAGLAFQLQDDVLGLFGEQAVTGKSTDSDYQEGKKTFPVVAAFARADLEGRRRLEWLWSEMVRSAAMTEQARAELVKHGGLEATRRVIQRATQAAQRAALQLPPGGGARAVLQQLITQLATRRF